MKTRNMKNCLLYFYITQILLFNIVQLVFQKTSIVIQALIIANCYKKNGYSKYTRRKLPSLKDFFIVSFLMIYRKTYFYLINY